MASAATTPPVSTNQPMSGNTPEQTPRTLILCFDGTSNQFDGDNTNVVKFYSLLKKDEDFDQQLCYYQPGIGTYFNPGVVSPVFQWCAKILDEAFAWYLDEHVRGGYQFLMQNYVPGDKICIFGFSRGAYTARALAGMLHKIGLLPRDNPEQVPFAYKLYKKTDDESLALAAGFKQTFCRNVLIEFVGVWETVSSVGVIMGRTLPFVTGNTTIKTFRHALALDEHRVKFLPNLYHRDTPEQSAAETPAVQADDLGTRTTAEALAKGNTAVKRPTAAGRRQKSLGSWMRRWPSKNRQDPATMPMPKVKQENADLESGGNTESSSESTSSSASGGSGDVIAGGTDVLEVWFVGCHSDVGGGSVTDDTKISLSDITLRWMVREVVLAQCGISFDQAALVRANIPDAIFTGVGMSLPKNAATTRDGATHPAKDVGLPSQSVPANGGTEQQLKVLADPVDGSGSGSASDPLDVDVAALQPIHDELQLKKAWWLLEILPLSYQYQDAASGKSVRKWWYVESRPLFCPDGFRFSSWQDTSRT
ncbi:hypothetical protein OH76DRAFT_1410973 [Lentinus brumalis]|uniref:T6SS Phospholipase effector Tle1-like catalytic domain-containing protein n=1 Tax=Lentinus brumalis TaxID=2498619 RepID=A0A371CQS0_9APHY|nr:hypothetical protein OH76DRAFT_1410973 [Polyporus brumalis]